MTRRSLIVVAAALLSAVALAAPGLMSLLPSSGPIGGWTVLPGSDRKGCTAKDFYSMYDGAAPAMMQAGLTAAGQRIYQYGKTRLTVDLYRFKSQTQAKAYYQKRRSEIVGKPGFGGSDVPDRGFAAAVCGRTTVGYRWFRGYYFALSVNAATTNDRARLVTLADCITRNIAVQK